MKQTVKTNIGQIAEIGENAENAEETAQATERAEFGLDGLVADVNIPRGTVVLAATPIGNTGDASARLIALMEGADIVAAEDTRRLYALANRLGIRVPGRVVAYHDHNERDKADGLLDQVEQGATVLVVSDAGMPTINDPGLAIVRRAIERGLPVTCAPGPSAVLDALCLSGLPTDRFCYEGFLPRKHSERVQHLRALKSERRTIVFYETLHRIDESMADLLDVFGPNRKMALCRELTKDYEQIRRGTIAEIRQSVVDDPPRGEMVLVIAGASEEEADAAAPATLSIEDLAVLSVDRAQEDNLRIKDAISQVVAEHPLSDGSLANRKQVYNAVLAMKLIASGTVHFQRFQQYPQRFGNTRPADLRKIFQHCRRRRRIGDQPLAQLRRIFRDMPQHILRGVGAARHQRRQFDRRRRRFYQCPLPRVRLIFRRCATSFVAFAMVSMLFMSLPMTFATFRALFISLACRAPRLCRRLPCLSRLSRLPWFFRRPLRFTHIRHCFPSIVRKTGVPVARCEYGWPPA